MDTPQPIPREDPQQSSTPTEGPRLKVLIWPSQCSVPTKARGTRSSKPPFEGTGYMRYGWYMFLCQFLDNSDSPSIVEQ